MIRFQCLAILLFLISTVAPCQNPGKYERGTVIAVARHESAPGDNDRELVRYDVSVKIKNTIYVVLYTPPNGANSVEYAAGIDFLFLVGKTTLTFNSKLSGSTEMPILRTEALAEQSVLDWSKAPGQYFAMKMENLSQTLGLSIDQQTRIKPIIEQEAAEAGQVCFTPTVPPKDRLNRWEKLVRASDAKMKPILSQTQWEKLHEIRKQQKQEIKELIAKNNSPT
jgi:hypothetical protein